MRRAATKTKLRKVAAFLESKTTAINNASTNKPTKWIKGGSTRGRTLRKITCDANGKAVLAGRQIAECARDFYNVAFLLQQQTSDNAAGCCLLRQHHAGGLTMDRHARVCYCNRLLVYFLGCNVLGKSKK